MGHLTTENRHGLVVDTRTTQVTGMAEREAAIDMLSHKPAADKATVGADRAYDTELAVRATGS